MTIAIAAHDATVGTASPTAGADDKLRADIQALRGLAVLLVVLHHSGLVASLQAGYLGVDIFFVVSGYLITGIVQRGLEAGTFSFAEFYFRRAKRLLPAAYVVFFATAAAAPLFLTRSALADFSWQLAGATTFTGNIALWLQMGYFENAAQLKPLLHVWSLSIEEQYYLLLPLSLALAPRRFWKAGALAVFAISLGLCLALAASKPGATFYLLPTRAWELALGSVGALVFARAPRPAAFAWLLWPALLVLVLLPFLPVASPHPGVDALLVCIATLVVILVRHPLLEGKLPVAALARVGDMSYSLYLVHWPVFAFAANAWVSDPPAPVRAALLAASGLMAWLLHRYVEQPARQAVVPANRKHALAAVAGTVALSASGFIMAAWSGGGTAAEQGWTRANGGLGACDYERAYVPGPACQNAPAPAILLWGDSFAMHLAQGIAATTDKGLAQATKSACGPFVGIAKFEATGLYNRRRAEDCVAFNRSVLDHLANTPSIEVVVLAGTFAPAEASASLLAIAPGGPPNDVRGDTGAALRSMQDTVEAVRATGKRVVVVAPPPTSAFDISRCLELKASGKLIFGADNPACSISEQRYRSAHADVLSFLDRLEHGRTRVAVLRFDSLLCRGGGCSVELDGTPLYRDAGHFSVAGGVLVAKRLGLGAHIMAQAR
jgi:peptidoglycan/LPS O-acetylase OafA/YrhL